MRILWLQWRDIRHPWGGGAEVYMHQIARRLAARGHQVVAVTSWHPGLRRVEELGGYTVVRVGDHDLYPLQLPRVLARYRGWADVIVEDTSKVPLYLPLLRPVHGLPVVAVVHHLNRGIYFQELDPLRGALGYVSEALMPRLYSRLPRTLIVAVSESTREELLKLGAKASRVAVVPNAIDLDAMPRPRGCSKDSTPLVVYLSRFKWYKRPHHALLAFRIAAREMPGARMVVAGRGTEALWPLVERLGLRGRVEVLGEVSEEAKAELFCRAWVHVQTSMKEGFGLTVLEAAAYETPTVAYRVPGLSESVKHNVTGLLVEPGDIGKLAAALLRLLGDEGLRRRMGRAAKRLARVLNWDRTTSLFERALRAAAGQHRYG